MPRFSHFLAVRLPQAVPHVQRLQRLIVAESSELERCCVPPEKSHLTLFPFDADEQQAAEALAACAPIAAAMVGTLAPRLRVSGLGSFSTRVVYAHVAADEGLARLAALRLAMMDEFRQRGIQLEEPRPGQETWSAHLTLLKGSRVQWAAAPRGNVRGRGSMKPPTPGPVIPHACWTSIPAEHTDLGEHLAASIELCPLGRRGTAADGFYPVLGSLPLGGGTAGQPFLEPGCSPSSPALSHAGTVHTSSLPPPPLP